MEESSNRLIRINFTTADGVLRTHSGTVGETVMDVALDNGVPGIIAQCGGGCTCCTCHCWVKAPWLNKVEPPHVDELDMLEYAWGRNDLSRLACQVVLGPECDGMEVEVPEQQA